MWKFYSITTNNFGILKGEQTQHLEDKSIIGIRAEYDEDPSRSNRAGKTTFIEAFRYALTGDIRGKKPEMAMITHGEKVMWVELDLVNVDTGERRKIRRGRDHKNKGLLTIDWIEKTADAQAEIDELLGLDKDLEFTNYFKQADINGFMDLSPAEKGALLTKWITKGHWKEKEEKATEDRDAVKMKLKDNESVQKALESVIELTEPLEQQLQEAEAELIEAEAIHKKSVTRRANQFAEYKKLKAEKEGAQEQIDTIELENMGLEKKRQVVERQRQDYQSLKDLAGGEREPER